MNIFLNFLFVRDFDAEKKNVIVWLKRLNIVILRTFLKR